jgi:virginiamycin B lyase
MRPIHLLWSAGGTSGLWRLPIWILSCDFSFAIKAAFCNAPTGYLSPPCPPGSLNVTTNSGLVSANGGPPAGTSETCLLYAAPGGDEGHACPSGQACLPDALMGETNTICTPLLSCSDSQACPGALSCAYVDPTTGNPTGTCVDATDGSAADCGSQEAGPPNSAKPDSTTSGAEASTAPVDATPSDVATEASASCTVVSPAITEFAIASTSLNSPTSITLGPDGDLWFPLNAASGAGAGTGDAIGRMTPDGASSQVFTLPTVDSGPWTVAAGPDGKIWFTEIAAGQIGHITTDGTEAVELSLPTAGSRPNGIAAAPDGTMWFTEQAANKVGWVATTGGTAAEIAIPTAASSPTGIVAGPDGTMWFAAEQAGNKIGHVATTAGAVPIEYAIPTPGASPQSITVGPDGNLWFAEFGGSKIGQITPAGVIHEWATPTPGSGS